MLGSPGPGSVKGSVFCHGPRDLLRFHRWGIKSDLWRLREAEAPTQAARHIARSLPVLAPHLAREAEH